MAAKKGYQDIVRLAGLVFLKRDFVKEVDEKGLEAVFQECPYGDLTDEQRAIFEAAFKNPRLREIVEQWWKTYDELRAGGVIPASNPWEPG